jgi:hypothetical protein
LSQVHVIGTAISPLLLRYKPRSVTQVASEHIRGI